MGTFLSSLQGDIFIESRHWKAFKWYCLSKKHYNDIRRYVRPWRIWSPATLARAEQLLRHAIRAAATAWHATAGTPFELQVRAWLDWLNAEIQWLRPPTFICASRPAPWQPLVHDNCFGYGSFAWTDFLSFFEALPYDKGLRLFATVSRTAREIIVQVREENVNMPALLARWKACRGHPDQTGFVRLFFDTERDTRRLQMWCIFPRGTHVVYREMLVLGRQDCNLLAARLAEGWRTTFDYDAHSWRLAMKIRLDRLGKPLGPGTVWGFNIAANTHIKRNHAVAWCKGYEVGPGNPVRMGKIIFQ